MGSIPTRILTFVYVWLVIYFGNNYLMHKIENSLLKRKIKAFWCTTTLPFHEGGNCSPLSQIRLIGRPYPCVMTRIASFWCFTFFGIKITFFGWTHEFSFVGIWGCKEFLQNTKFFFRRAHDYIVIFRIWLKLVVQCNGKTFKGFLFTNPQTELSYFFSFLD